jgi:hypothetical protein
VLEFLESGDEANLEGMRLEMRRNKRDRSSWSGAAGLGLAAILCVSSCADFWGFEDLRNSVDGGARGDGGVIFIGGSGGRMSEIGSGGGSGGLGIGGGGMGLGGGGTPRGSGGLSGSGGASRTGGAPATGGATSMGGAGGLGGFQTTGGRSGTGGAGGRGGATATGGVAGAMGSGGSGGCSPSNCSKGCCAMGRCVTATSAQQCGTGGGLCTACGGCQLCGPNGACMVDPTSNWIVRCASAELTVAPATGSTWDPIGVAGDGPEPDPFCQFEKPAGVIDNNTGAATRTVADSFTATWNQTVTAANTTITADELMSANADSWRVWVGDSELNGRGTLACQVRPPLQASTLVDGQLTITNVQNCVSLSLTFICQP